jgi:hypothetical protein
MPALRPIEVGRPSDQPPNIFAAGRPAPAAALSGGDSRHPRAGGAPAGQFGAAGAAPAPALPTLAHASCRRRRWARPGRRALVSATALVLGALGCAAALNELGPPDRPGADTNANVQSAPPSTPPPQAGSPRARSKDSAAAKPRRLNRHERAPVARAETLRGAKRHARRVRRPRRDAAPAPLPDPEPAAAPAPPALAPPPTAGPQPAPRPPGPQPLPVAPGSPPEFM